MLTLIALIVPAFLDPTNIFPESLSAICLGVSIFSTNISIEKPFGNFIWFGLYPFRIRYIYLIVMVN